MGHWLLTIQSQAWNFNFLWLFSENRFKGTYHHAKNICLMYISDPKVIAFIMVFLMSAISGVDFDTEIS